MRLILTSLWQATKRFVNDGSTAIASNVALSLLLSLFPFLMLITSLIRIWGEPEVIDTVFELLLGHWPADSSQAIAEQVKIIVAQRPHEFFSLSTFIVLFLATNGVESARDGLNRAYGVTETRAFWWRRVQAVLFVVCGAFAIILAAIVLIATPLVWDYLTTHLTWLEPLSWTMRLVKFGFVILLLAVTLFVFHLVLPAGKRRLRHMIGGILITILGILLGSELFAIYLQSFASYTTLYAGLAGTMVAIVYLYCVSALILFGAEFNAAYAEVSAKNASM